MPNTQVSQEEYGGYQLSPTAELELTIFKATHSLNQMDESLRKAFRGYMAGDDIDDDDRLERESVFDDIEGLRRIIRFLL